MGQWWSLGRVPAEAEEGGESSTSGRNDFLGLLCWGYRGPTCTYANISYSVINVLHDSHIGGVWYPEPHVTANVIRNGQAFKIEGTFRHTSCMRVDVLGDEFTNLSCSMCSGIPLEADFRKRIMREDLTFEKRGTRCTGGGRRLGYLQLSELAKHGRDLRRKLKAEKLLHFSIRARIVQLKVKRPSLRELARDASGSHNALKFCHSILNAHRCGAFGGKPALWDFLHDVAQNVSRDDRGNRYSENTRCLGEVMKVYGGRRMIDMFALNFAGPSYSQVKQDVKKGVQFVPGEHLHIFASVAEIYRDAKALHNIVGPVPVILVEDETKMKGRVAWEPKWDTLAGFCGAEENHVCHSSFRPHVGNGEEGYRKLVESFTSNRKAGFARVLVVNPLHPKLP